MSELIFYPNLFTREFDSPQGGNSADNLKLVFGATPNVALVMLDSSSGDDIEVFPHIRSVKMAVGYFNQPPTAGKFRLKITDAAGTRYSAPMVFNITPAALLTATGASVVTTLGGSGWRIQFADQTSIIDVADDSHTEANTLMPYAFIRIRIRTLNAITFYDVELLQTPLAFSDNYDRLLATGPSIEEIREGSSSGSESGLKRNAIQAIVIPTAFVGTYYITWDYRTTIILGTQASPDDIAAALNGMYTDGKIRFEVTNPEKNKAYVEFVGLLKELPQPLMVITVNSFVEGRVIFDLKCDRAALADALRGVEELEDVPLELQLEVVDNAEDIENEEVAGRLIKFQQTCTVRTELIFPELSSVQQVDWTKPPLPKNYLPFNRDQIITGNQHYVAVLGDGEAYTFGLVHNLGTAAAHVAVRENKFPGRLIEAGERSIVFDSANQLTVSFPYELTLGEMAVVITTAGPKSAFSDHDHFITDIDELAEYLAALALRLTTIEDHLPFTNPSLEAAIGSSSLSIALPSKSELYPGRFSRNPAYASLTAGFRTAALLPAIHIADGDVTNIVLPFPDVTANKGKVVRNNTANAVPVPAALGHRSTSLPVDGYLGCDGRVWYVVSHDAGKSYYPVDMQRTMFELPINSQMLRPGMSLDIQFNLSLAIAGSTSRAQYSVVIEYGIPLSDTTPVTPGPNLKAIDWKTATPLSSQRVTLTDMEINHHLGIRIARNVDNSFEADAIYYDSTQAALTVPSGPDFVLRCRLIDFDTENSESRARGVVFYSFSEGLATFIK